MSLRTPLVRRELGPLLLLVLLAGGIWGFLALAGEVREGDTNRADRALMLALRERGNLADPLGPPWVEDAARSITALGSVVVLGILTLSVAGFLVLDHKARLALLLVLAVGGGIATGFLLKEAFQRPRPMLVPHAVRVVTTSFPSAHSMSSAATYLTLGAFLARVQKRRRLKVYLLGLAIFLTLIVGVTRVYLGVHWPTDVLAGWTAGGCWALLCWNVAIWLQRRGEVEREGGARQEEERV